MSKRNRPWHCLGCGGRMHRETAAPAKEALARLLVRAAIVHVCGCCKTLHLETDRGRLRTPTVAERFRIEAEMGKTLDRIRATAVPQSKTPAATLVICKE